MSESLKIGSILSLAKRKGHLKPAYQPDECLAEIVNNANQLLILIQKSPWLTTSEIADRSSLAANTCSIYLKELLALKLLLRNRFTSEATWTLREDREKEINVLEQEVSQEFQNH